jgi:integrase
MSHERMPPILGRGSEAHGQVVRWPLCHTQKALFILGVRSGFRISEMLSLRIGDVFQHGKVVDHVTVARKHMEKKKGRSVRLHPEARAAISVWLDVLARQLRLPQAKDLDPACPVFCSRVREDDGTRRAVARETAWRILEEAVGANELTGKIGTHGMRKTFASRMYDQLGKDLVKVQHAMGHRNINSTVSYLSFREEDVVNAILAA